MIEANNSPLFMATTIGNGLWDNQNTFMKSAADKIGMPRNGWSVSRCGSPEIMHKACDATANSKNMLSSGSLLALIFSAIEKGLAYFSISSTTSTLSSDVKYLSNLWPPQYFQKFAQGNIRDGQYARGCSFPKGLVASRMFNKKSTYQGIGVKNEKVRLHRSESRQAFPESVRARPFSVANRQ